MSSLTLTKQKPAPKCLVCRKHCFWETLPRSPRRKGSIYFLEECSIGCVSDTKVTPQCSGNGYTVSNTGNKDCRTYTLWVCFRINIRESFSAGNLSPPGLGAHNNPPTLTQLEPRVWARAGPSAVKVLFLELSLGTAKSCVCRNLSILLEYLETDVIMGCLKTDHVARTSVTLNMARPRCPL